MLAAGCASTNRWASRPSQAPDASELEGFLGRWDSWGSLGARVKLKAVIGDSTFQARGHLLYLIGERYEVGFAKPYDQLLGNLYVTPEHVVYWDTANKPHVFSAGENADLEELFPIRLPNWDIRDLFPFPVSGRTSGFQVDSLWHEGGEAHVLGHSDDASYRLTVLDGNGVVGEERVFRQERDPIVKKYSRTRLINNWPLSRRITCTDTSGNISITWYLGGIVLDAPRRELTPHDVR
ncbi:MAG: hypothetical protein PHI18_08830 [bacterium]|nr:hypothetical protein [bacterium]